MNIQITGLPENQKIKSINFNIVFDDSNVESITSINTINQEPKYSIKTTEAPSTLTSIESAIYTPKTQEDKESDIPKPEEIDISKRVAKIDPNMLDEMF